MDKYKILIVDDEMENLNLLRRTFIRDYHILMAESAEKALEILEKEHENISLIISDQRMIGLSGTELFKTVCKKYSGIYKILLTAYTDVESLVEAINEGQVFKYVTKPWDAEDLKLTAKRAIEAFTLSKENKILLDTLFKKNIELKKIKEYSDERVEEERLRISRELHDDTCQTLASISISMEICLKILEKHMDPENVNFIKNKISEMKEQLKNASHQVRRISMDLRPSELDSLGFISTIEQFINNFNKDIYSPTIDFQVTGNIITLSQKLELTLFRLIQESINNAKKHSKADNILISVHFNDESVEINIKDNGVGFELPSRLEDLIKKGHLGLVGMKERINLFNGRFEIDSQPGKGTSISFCANIEH